jgi:TolA-binding protein
VEQLQGTIPRDDKFKILSTKEAIAAGFPTEQGQVYIMNEITGKRKTRIIPKITDAEYQAKYIESLSNYQNGEWNLSLDGFKFLIQADGNNQLADNCQYWIGEIYYSQKDFRRSIKEFEKVFTFPGTNKSDDAQFKLGLCYVNIGQIDKAKQEFENLLEFYPNSEYYKKGQDYLRQY